MYHSFLASRQKTVFARTFLALVLQGVRLLCSSKAHYCTTGLQTSFESVVLKMRLHVQQTQSFCKNIFSWLFAATQQHSDVTNRSEQSRLWIMWRVWMNWEHLDGLCLVVWMWTITNTEVRDSGWEMAGWDQKIEGRVGGKRNGRGESTTLHSPSRLFAL